MGYVVIGDAIFGDPFEGSDKAIQNDPSLDLRCDFCNRPAPVNIFGSYWVCPTCHVVK